MTTSRSSFSFFIPLEPMPSPRPRFVVRGKFASAYLPREYMTWKESAAEYVRGVNQLPPEAFFETPSAVRMVVKATKPKTSKLTHPGPDVDNYAKGVLDAMTDSKAWWADDKYVVRLDVEKMWAGPDEPPGIEVTVTYL